MLQPRTWQKAAFKTVDRLNSQRITSDAPVIMPVNACVGSGKTNVACYAFGKFISENAENRTVQMFVTPRIRLCDQQNKEISGFLSDEFGFTNKKDYEIIPVDYRQNCFSKSNENLYAKHVIFVICDESLWGVCEGPDPAFRWHEWLRKFESYVEQGYKLGWAALDEAHNYEKREHLIFDGNEPGLAAFFKIILMSGTPSAFQKEWSKAWKSNVCSCSPKMAMDNGWICKPKLNLVMGDSGTQWARAVAAVLKREISSCRGEVFMPRLMVNCSGIDDVKHLVDLSWVRERAGKEFHLVTLHSKKGYSDGAGVLKFAEPTIDCRTVDADEAYNAIESIDNGGFFKDELPVIVAQVQMLGEGINVESFNSILTASNSDKTAMQQIGRCIRNYWIGDKNKVHDGHANVYVMTDNLNSVKNLLVNLNEYDLTDECFSWGDRLDIATGSGPEIPDDADAPELNAAAWEPIDPNNDIEIIDLYEAIDKKRFKYMASEAVVNLFSGDADGDGIPDLVELEEILKLPAVSSKIKIWGLEKSGATEIIMTCLKKIKAIRRGSDFMRRLWSIDRKKCIAATLQCNELAAFLSEHISADKLDKITK